MSDNPPQNADCVVDLDEYGQPVGNRYLRLGAGAKAGGQSEEGLYVRFSPGFGLNVYIGHRKGIFSGSDYRGTPSSYRDEDGIAMSIGGWEKLCSLVDEWRARTAHSDGPGADGSMEP